MYTVYRLEMSTKIIFTVHFIIMLWTLKHFSPMHIIEMSNKIFFPSCFIFTLWTPKLLSPMHSLQMGSKITSVCGFIITFWTLKLSPLCTELRCVERYCMISFSFGSGHIIIRLLTLSYPFVHTLKTKAVFLCKHTLET